MWVPLIVSSTCSGGDTAGVIAATGRGAASALPLVLGLACVRRSGAAHGTMSVLGVFRVRMLPVGIVSQNTRWLLVLAAVRAGAPSAVKRCGYLQGG